MLGVETLSWTCVEDRSPDPGSVVWSAQVIKAEVWSSIMSVWSENITHREHPVAPGTELLRLRRRTERRVRSLAPPSSSCSAPGKQRRLSDPTRRWLRQPVQLKRASRAERSLLHSRFLQPDLRLQRHAGSNKTTTFEGRKCRYLRQFLTTPDRKQNLDGSSSALLEPRTSSPHGVRRTSMYLQRVSMQ